jgi:transcriptional regulatory protein RtcR
MEKKIVVFGHIGRFKDLPSEDEPDRWRPTLSIFTHKEFPVHRFHLMYHPETIELAQEITREIQGLSKQTEVKLHEMDIQKPFDFEEAYEKLYQFCTARDFDTDREDYYFHITTNTHVWQIGIFMVINTNLFPGKILQTWAGAKGSRAGYTVVDLNEQRYARITNRLEKKQTNEEILKSGITTKNARYNELINKIEQYAANSEVPILLLGKTGTGKTYLAGKIFEVKKKSGLIGKNVETMIEMDCITIPESLLESELFGHKKGSFTGATEDRQGLLLQADKGLLFIDEIGNLSMNAQAKLLKVIEDKKIRPVGGEYKKDIKESDFQLICATNKDLAEEVKAGRFRDDLLSRFDVLTFELPELRERKEDIGPYIKEYWLKEKQKNDKKQIHYDFAQKAWDLYTKFAQSSEASWETNFRALNSSLERMCIEAKIKGSYNIDADIVKKEIENLKGKWGASTSRDPRIPEDMDPVKRVQLEYVLKVCDESDTIAAASRKLYASSLSRKKSSNDSDRLRKYLATCGLVWGKQGVVVK